MPTHSPVKKLSALAVSDWHNHQEVEATKAFEAYTKGLESTLSTLKEIAKDRNLDSLISAEEMLVLWEREMYGKQDTSVVASLNAAVADFDVIKKSSETVRAPAEYQAAATTYHAKKTFQGVVADGCHEARNSHVTRLGNRMATVGLSVPEKNVLRQRQSNMRVAKDLYMELQRVALGLKEPERPKGRGLEL
jgi:hypothetical protein